MKWGARVLRVRSVSREEVWFKKYFQGTPSSFKARLAAHGARVLRGPGWPSGKSLASSRTRREPRSSVAEVGQLPSRTSRISPLEKPFASA